MLEKVTVIGSGSWATALVKIFTDSAMQVSWLVRDETLAQQIVQSGRNPRYLSEVAVNTSRVKPFACYAEALKGTQAVVFAVPSFCLMDALRQIDHDWLEDKLILSSIKSFVPGAGSLPSKYIEDFAGLSDSVMVMAGPCHAEEIAMERNTYLTIAGENVDQVNEFSSSLKVKYIQQVENNDPCGVEYVAILKNIIGIATGIANGLNYGENFQAVLTSNAMREVERFLQVMQPAKRDLFDSAYFGDLLVTAYSDYSRNRTLGRLIGRGVKTSHALHSMEMVAEGYRASEELQSLICNLNICLPIMNSVFRILHQHASPFNEFKLIENQLR